MGDYVLRVKQYFNFTAEDLIVFLKHNPEMCRRVIHSSDKRSTPSTIISDNGDDNYLVGWFADKKEYGYFFQTEMRLFSNIAEAVADYLLFSWEMPRLTKEQATWHEMVEDLESHRIQAGKGIRNTLLDSGATTITGEQGQVTYQLQRGQNTIRLQYTGCISTYCGSGGLVPTHVKGPIKHRRPNGDHALSARTGPAHSRCGQPVFELLDLRFDAPRANR